MYGPAAWEVETPRYGPVEKVAVVSDVHANVPALRAVLAEVEREGVDLVVSCGDLTWGPEPDLTAELMATFGTRVLFVRGNAERAVLGLARGEREPETPRDAWMPTRHSPVTVDMLDRFPFSVVVDVVGLGPVRFCHGSPRSDTEVVTTETPAERFADLSADIQEGLLVTGHTHMQFDRQVAGMRSVNPGSVGLPFHVGTPGTAYWALLGPDVSLRQTRYDVKESVARCHDSGDPSAEKISSTLTTPPTPAEVIEYGETRVFSD